MTSKRITTFSSLVLVLLLFFSCEHFQVAPPNYRGGNCDPDTIYFVNDVAPILNSNCALSGCHDSKSAQHGVVLNSYENILRTVGITKGNGLKSELIEKMRSKKEPMPPTGNLDDSYIAKVRKWIDQGALNNSCTPGCDSLSFTYNKDIVRIINTNCVSCHSTGSTILLNSYAEVKARADDGKLWGSINHLSGYKAMPSDFSYLSDCDIGKIRNWIANGAKND